MFGQRNVNCDRYKGSFGIVIVAVCNGIRPAAYGYRLKFVLSRLALSPCRLEQLLVPDL